MAKPKKASKSKKLTEFTCFKKLAPELRIMIWKFAMPGANIVEILVDEGRDEDYNMKIIPYAHYKVPTLLQVSRESRGFALQIYTKILPKSFSDKPVFFNLDVDVLSINRSTLERLCEHGGFLIRSRVADPPQPAFSGPLLQELRRLQLLDDIPFWLLAHMKKILEALGQPEIIVLHKPVQRRVHAWGFLELEWDIKNEWTVAENENGKCYVPKLHILTEFQLQRMLKNIDSPPARPKKVKVYIPPTRRSDRFVERPFNYFEEGPEIEEEDTEDDYDEN